MIKVGIDTAAFYSSHYFLDLATLASTRGIDKDKFYVGLGQRKMAVAPPDEGIVTLAANAGLEALKDIEVDDIDMLLFATESSIDQSKAAGIFVHKLLNLPTHCRVVELKQACYSATAGLQLAMTYLQANPSKKILLIAADIAKYGLNTTGESSQGCGAVAMVLATNPRMLAIEPEAGYYTEDNMDFWRPNYREEALVEGKHSCDLYLRLLKESWQQYSEKSGRNYEQHQHFCFHIPIPRLAEKAQQKLAILNGQSRPTATGMQKLQGDTLTYSKEVGNCYTASLYLGLISLLDTCSEDLTNHRIGFYSYGSGSVGEFFSGIVQENYHAALHTKYHRQMLAERTELTQAEYEAFYSFKYPRDGSSVILPKHQTGKFRLSGLQQHKRIYETVK